MATKALLTLLKDAGVYSKKELQFFSDAMGLPGGAGAKARGKGAPLTPAKADSAETERKASRPRQSPRLTQDATPAKRPAERSALEAGPSKRQALPAAAAAAPPPPAAVQRPRLLRGAAGQAAPAAPAPAAAKRSRQSEQGAQQQAAGARVVPATRALRAAAQPPPSAARASAPAAAQRSKQSKQGAQQQAVAGSVAAAKQAPRAAAAPPLPPAAPASAPAAAAQRPKHSQQGAQQQTAAGPAAAATQAQRAAAPPPPPAARAPAPAAAQRTSKARARGQAPAMPPAPAAAPLPAAASAAPAAARAAAKRHSPRLHGGAGGGEQLEISPVGPAGALPAALPASGAKRALPALAPRPTRAATRSSSRSKDTAGSSSSSVDEIRLHQQLSPPPGNERPAQEAAAVAANEAARRKTAEEAHGEQEEQDAVMEEAGGQGEAGREGEGRGEGDGQAAQEPPGAAAEAARQQEGAAGAAAPAVELQHCPLCDLLNEWPASGQELLECSGCGGLFEAEQVLISQGAAEEVDQWVACDLCDKWRIVSAAIRAQVAQAPEGTRWSCSQLKEGQADCSTPEDVWKPLAPRLLSPAPAAGAAGLQRRAGAAAQRLPAGYQRHQGQAPRYQMVLPGEALAAAAAAGRAAGHTVQALPRTMAKAALPLYRSFADATNIVERMAAPDPAAPGRVTQAWRCQLAAPPPGFEEFIPGRDELIGPQALAAGLDAVDAATGEHILCTCALPSGALPALRAYVRAGMALYLQGKLPLLVDGRQSAGPLDLIAFMAQPGVRERVQRALAARRARMLAQGLPVPAKDFEMLAHVLHVSPDGRKAYVGEEWDLTRNGTRIMFYNKSWTSCPIRSWSGGKKLADMPGSAPKKVVKSKLSQLLAAEEGWLEGVANQAWRLFAEHPATAAAAKAMMDTMEADQLYKSSQLGQTGWNAYSLNIDYRTSRHLDAKNMEGSYSALLVLETGGAEEQPFCGGYYMLPQFAKALDIRQGIVLFHRSGARSCGLHANSGLHLPHPDIHRVAIVLYQTRLRQSKAAAAAAVARGPGAGPQDASTSASGGGGAAAEEDGEDGGELEEDMLGLAEALLEEAGYAAEAGTSTTAAAAAVAVAGNGGAAPAAGLSGGGAASAEGGDAAAAAEAAEAAAVPGRPEVLQPPEQVQAALQAMKQGQRAEQALPPAAVAAAQPLAQPQGLQLRDGQAEQHTMQQQRQLEASQQDAAGQDRAGGGSLVRGPEQTEAATLLDQPALARPPVQQPEQQQQQRPSDGRLHGRAEAAATATAADLPPAAADDGSRQGRRMTRQQAAAGQQAPSPAALVGMATAAAARAAVAAAPRAGASSRAVLAPPAAAASKRAAPVKAPKRPAPAAGGASVAAQHSFRPLRRDPMVQFADGNYYQASVLQVTDGRVLLACQPGEWALPQEFWLPRSSPRIWAGSYAPAAWRHKGGGAWQPRSQQAPDKAAAGAAGGSNAAEAQQPAAAEGGGHDEGVPGAAGNDAAAADTAPAAAADDAAGAAAGVSTVAEGPSAP